MTKRCIAGSSARTMMLEAPHVRFVAAARMASISATPRPLKSPTEVRLIISYAIRDSVFLIDLVSVVAMSSVGTDYVAASTRQPPRGLLSFQVPGLTAFDKDGGPRDRSAVDIRCCSSDDSGLRNGFSLAAILILRRRRSVLGLMRLLGLVLLC